MRMITSLVRTAFLLVAVTAMAVPQQPSLVNARVERRSASAGLDREFHGIAGAQTEPAWIGYAVPATSGRHQMCCGSYTDDGSDRCCGRCRLEGGAGNNFSVDSDDHPTAKLEASPHVLILFRVENKKVEKVRPFSADCELDAGGRTVYWLTDVPPEESVALLASLVGARGGALPDDESDGDDEPSRLADGALTAIAMHAGPAADAALERFAAAGEPERIREKAAFWLGAARGRRGFEILDRLVRHDSSDRFREKTVFALFVNKEARATDTIIDVARNDSSPHVRGQALFWLAQRAAHKTEAAKATSAIRQAVENDPETEVKKKAVFALSQLPKDQSVPLLIQVARTNRNTAVRKQAMFWLGQSADSRALAFFEDILTH